VPQVPTSGSAETAGATGTVTDGKLTLVADQVKFDLSTIDASAGQGFTIVFDNKDSLPHNVAIFKGTDATGTNVFTGPIDNGPKTDDYQVPALAAGTYYFQCDVHPGSMYGTITVK
jgi:plastocyanin